jgi:hypothetical protein
LLCDDGDLGRHLECAAIRSRLRDLKVKWMSRTRLVLLSGLCTLVLLPIATNIATGELYVMMGPG